MKPTRWPRASTIETPRLTLEPLRVEHADEMASLLDDESLYDFIGGGPSSLDELRKTYSRQVVGRSSDGERGWLNWIVRHRAAGSVVGTVQATLDDSGDSTTAYIAWMIGSSHQGRGYAKEAADGMLTWLREQNVESFAAHIRPDHTASIAIARHLGLRATRRLAGEEVLWISQAPPSDPGQS